MPQATDDRISDGPRAVGYYTARDVARLAGVSSRKVGSWARYGIILPSVSRRPNIYSYADSGEAILAHYLVTQGKAPKDIKQIVRFLKNRYGPWPLATAPLGHDGKLLLVKDPERDVWVSVDRPEHEVIDGTLLDLKLIRNALRHGGWVTLEHPRDHIEVDPDRHSGDPVIRGRRLSVSLVAALHKAPNGRTVLQEDYGLSEAEIDDAVGYEKDLAKLAKRAA